MNKIRGYLALSLLIATAAGAVPPVVISDAAIRKILVERIDARKQGVAIVVGVIEPAGRRVVAYGAFAENDKRVPNGDTVFEIGSVTKVFTALLLADAVQRGELALDDPISKHLPAEVKVPAKITVRQLATHTSALPRLPSNLAPKDATNPYADYTVAQLHEFLAGYELPRDPGTTYDYSNLGAGLLGQILARRAGVDYEPLVRTRIIAPLGMKSTAIKLSDALQKRLAPGHDGLGRRAANWDLPTLAGAGALRSTANDMLHFLAATLRYNSSPLSPAMSSLLASRRPTSAPGTEIALGWHITTSPSGKELVWHNGGTGGYRSYLGYDPKSRTGVVVLANLSNNEGVDDIGRHLLDPTLPLLPPREVLQELTLGAEILDRYVGHYELAPSFVLTITREGKRLFAQATGQARLEIFPADEKKFFLKAVDAQITFTTGDDGRATGLLLHQNGGVAPGKRVEKHPAAPKQRKAIAVDPALLDRLTGRYQLSPAFALAVTREGDRLFVQATAQPKFELHAESERDFFLEEIDAQLTFVTNGPGPATKVILHQNGLDQDAKRVE
jgi:serine-type D-Ala-D-Ala carboxypeptidase/endopeptidase